jgi:hypothetical protein
MEVDTEAEFRSQFQDSGCGVDVSEPEDDDDESSVEFILAGNKSLWQVVICM